MTTPFEIFREDCAEVISYINYMLEEAAEEENNEQETAPDIDFWDF